MKVFSFFATSSLLSVRVVIIGGNDCFAVSIVWAVRPILLSLGRRHLEMGSWILGMDSGAVPRWGLDVLELGMVGLTWRNEGRGVEVDTAVKEELGLDDLKSSGAGGVLYHRG